MCGIICEKSYCVFVIDKEKAHVDLTLSSHVTEPLENVICVMCAPMILIGCPCVGQGKKN